MPISSVLRSTFLAPDKVDDLIKADKSFCLSEQTPRATTSGIPATATTTTATTTDCGPQSGADGAVPFASREQELLQLKKDISLMEHEIKVKFSRLARLQLEVQGARHSLPQVWYVADKDRGFLTYNGHVTVGPLEDLSYGVAESMFASASKLHALCKHGYEATHQGAGAAWSQASRGAGYVLEGMRSGAEMLYPGVQKL
ncbi:hypothetical protein CYMTET_50740, partial [Cymbomonas tetramitiformis]